MQESNTKSYTLISPLIESYCKSRSSEESNLLKELLKKTYERTRNPEMSIGHIPGIFLRILVKAINAKKILEIGTFTGYSALSMAESLPEDGKLITCDFDKDDTKLASEYFAKSLHGKKIQLLLGNAIDTIPLLTDIFDLIFIDADKQNYLNYWNLCLPKLRPGGLIVVDNTLWYGKVLDPTDETDFAIAEFNDQVKKDSRVDMVLLSIRDGITLAYKK